MSNYKKKEVMDYLTRKPLSEQDLQMAYEAGQQKLDSIPETQVASGEERVLNRQPFYQQPQQLIQDDIASPQVDGIPLYQGVKPGVAIEETMPTYVPPDMSPVTPSAPGLPDPQFKQIELATGGRAELKDGTKEPPKFIPMDLESVAFRLFRENLDNLTYNQKQTVYDHIEQNRNKKAKGGKAGSVTPMSNKLSSDPTGIGNFLETSLGQMLSKKTPNFLKVTTKLAAVTGTPLNALLGVAIDAEENKEKGLSDFETIAAGAYKGSTQDLLNFGDLIFRKLPEATYKKFVQDRPFLESLLNEPEYFQFADKQIDKYTSEKSVKDRIQNRAEYEVTKSIPINISDTEVPISMSSKEFKNLVESKKSEILNSNPDLKNLYKQEELNLAYGGRVKYANGSDDQESDLYIPPLNSEEDFFGKSIKMLPKEGLQGLYFGIKETPKYEEEQPIEISGSTIKELKQYLASRMPEQRPEIGYRDENLNISASKGFGPFANKGTMYEASYSPNKDVGTFFINKGPGYIGAGYGREDLGNFSISKTPFTTGAGYNYEKDNLSYGIQALVDKMGNKEAQARLKYKFANGGKVKK
jgi:hypothetical protein